MDQDLKRLLLLLFLHFSIITAQNGDIRNLGAVAIYRTITVGVRFRALVLVLVLSFHLLQRLRANNVFAVIHPAVLLPQSYHSGIGLEAVGHHGPRIWGNICNDVAQNGSLSAVIENKELRLVRFPLFHA